MLRIDDQENVYEKKKKGEIKRKLSRISYKKRYTI